ncbi:MAG: helix-turn-helix domain-containing protein [Burkholderiaceae bacterium]
MTARERLAFLVLDHLARRRIACGNSETSEIQMPLTQAEIGDHLGLSNVHVSRALGRLEKDGLLERLAGVIRVRDETALSRLASFEDRYDQIDTRWLTPQM